MLAWKSSIIQIELKNIFKVERVLVVSVMIFFGRNSQSALKNTFFFDLRMVGLQF